MNFRQPDESGDFVDGAMTNPPGLCTKPLLPWFLRLTFRTVGWRAGRLLDPRPSPRPRVNPKRVWVRIARGTQEARLANPLSMAITEGLVVAMTTSCSIKVKAHRLAGRNAARIKTRFARSRNRATILPLAGWTVVMGKIVAARLETA